jgi:hypothetical protein
MWPEENSESDRGRYSSGGVLNTKDNDSFLILAVTDMTYIQTTGDQKVGFDLEHQDTDTQHHYRAKRELTADEIVKVLVSYSVGSDDWKGMVDWEWLEL